MPTKIDLELKLKFETDADHPIDLSRQIAEKVTALVPSPTPRHALSEIKATAVEDTSKHPKRRTKRSASTPKADNIIQFEHDFAKYGPPAGNWPCVDKCMWLIYVVTEQADVDRLSCAQVSATFEHHFKTAGKLRPSHVSRDLKKALSKKMAASDTTQSPIRFYLLDGGIERIKSLISEPSVG